MENLYLAYIDIYQLYSLLNTHNIECGNWKIEKQEPIYKDFIIVNNLNESNYSSYIYYTQYIKYETLIYVLGDIYIKSKKLEKYENITKLYNVLNHIACTFSNVHSHLLEYVKNK